MRKIQLIQGDLDEELRAEVWHWPDVRSTSLKVSAFYLMTLRLMYRRFYIYNGTSETVMKFRKQVE